MVTFILLFLYPSYILLSYSPLTLPAQPLGEVSESLPLRGVHMDVLPVTDVLVVDNVVVHSLGTCG